MLRKPELNGGLDEPHGLFNQVDWTHEFTFPLPLDQVSHAVTNWVVEKRCVTTQIAAGRRLHIIIGANFSAENDG